MKILSKMLMCCFILTAAHTVSAASWRIKSLQQGNDGGFGYSGLHDASGFNTMSGPELSEIIDASGTYDDVSGALNFDIKYQNTSNNDVKTFNIVGDLLFKTTIDSVSSFLTYNSTLDYTGLGGLSGVAPSGEFGFKKGDVCCSGDADPNSFIEQMNGTYFMTLWGADGFYETPWGKGKYKHSTVGMDFRVELEQVPLPPALWLMFSGFGLIIAKSRKRVVVQV